MAAMPTMLTVSRVSSVSVSLAILVNQLLLKVNIIYVSVSIVTPYYSYVATML